MSDLTEPLNSYAPRPKKNGAFPMWIAVGVSAISMLICGVITYIFTKEHFAPANAYNPALHYELPDRYEMAASLRIPSLGDFKQTVFAKVDGVANKMQLSYFSGLSTFYYDGSANKNTYSVVPKFDKLQCFETTHEEAITLPTLIPYLPAFTKAEEQEEVNGVKCDVWTYTYENEVEKDGWVAQLPDERGYSGKYTFYVNAETGAPVTFHTVGHNVLLGGSPVGDYWMDYTYIRAVDAIEDSVFQPPFGMICEPSATAVAASDDSPSASTVDLASIMSHPTLASLGQQLSKLSQATKTIRDDVPTSACGAYTPSGKALPKSVDWVAKKYVADAQGFCASGITGTIEGQIAAKTGSVVPVSQQYWMDCSTETGAENGIAYGTNTVCGANDFAALSWALLRNNGRVPSSEAYGSPRMSYFNMNNFCHFYEKTNVNPFTGKTIEPVAVIDSCTHVNAAWKGTDVSQEERVNTLLDALANVGPISVSIAVSDDLYYYKSGVYADVEKCGADVAGLTHTVLATGYETDEAGNVSVTIRNSWSEVWGEKGYAKILVKSADGKTLNVCGVASAPVFVTLK